MNCFFFYRTVGKVQFLWKGHNLALLMFAKQAFRYSTLFNRKGVVLPLRLDGFSR